MNKIHKVYLFIFPGPEGIVIQAAEGLTIRIKKIHGDETSVDFCISTFLFV